MNFVFRRVCCIFALSGIFLLSIFSESAFAQFGQDLLPQMRSQMNAPITQGDQYMRSLDAPDITDITEMDTEIGEELLPEERAFEMPILADKTVDPAKYILGPGDLLSVYLWGELDNDVSGTRPAMDENIRSGYIRNTHQ